MYLIMLRLVYMPTIPKILLIEADRNDIPSTPRELIALSQIARGPITNMV